MKKLLCLLFVISAYASPDEPVSASSARKALKYREFLDAMSYLENQETDFDYSKLRIKIPKNHNFRPHPIRILVNGEEADCNFLYLKKADFE